MSRSRRLAIRAVHAGIAALGPVLRIIDKKRLEKPMAWIERRVKGVLFDCSMCGNCTLDVTALRCPARCLKGLRNGPCGGVRPNGHCEVDSTMPCAWLEIWQRNGELLPDRLPAEEHHFAERSTWIAEALEGMPTVQALPNKRTFPAGLFERELARGRFVVTAEIVPGTAANESGILSQAKLVAPWVAAITVTDSAGSHAAVSSMASCALLVRNGYTAILQMTCRDRNRIALQSDLLSAAALGVENVLCLSGDGVGNGDHPGAKPVFDLDSVSLLAAACTMRDSGTFLSGRKLAAPPDYFVGAAENPFAPPLAARVQRLRRKIDTGAQFLIMQVVYDVPAFELFMTEVRRLGLHKRAHILAGVGLPVSLKATRWLAQHVPGVRVPEQVLRQLEMSTDPVSTGVSLTIDTIRRLRAIEGLAGVHLLFSPRHLNLMGDVITQAGLSTIR